MKNLKKLMMMIHVKPLVNYQRKILKNYTCLLALVDQTFPKDKDNYSVLPELLLDNLKLF